MRHLFLHVGMEKTGTTSIQTTLFLNREVLAKHGIHYFDAGRTHSAVMAAAFQHGRPGTKASPDAAAHARSLLDSFLGSRPEGRFVISGEGMVRMPARDAQTMLSYLRERVDRLTVVCFVRPPRGYMVSSMQQAIRTGVRVEQLRTAGEPKYRGQIEKFLVDAPGIDAVLPLHDRQTLHRGCSIATILRIIGAPDTLYDALPLSQENPSLSQAGAAFLLALAEAGLPNKRNAQSEDDHRLRRIAHRLANALQGPKFTIPQSVLAAVLDRPEVKADIGWIETRLGATLSEPDFGNAEAADHWPHSALDKLDTKALSELALHMENEVAAARRGRSPQVGCLLAVLDSVQAELRILSAKPGTSPVLDREKLHALAAVFVGPWAKPAPPVPVVGAARRIGATVKQTDAH
jgi:hypothetical protein